VSLYDAAKDALKVAQKADNIELIQRLLDVQQQALEMQDKQYESKKQIDLLRLEVESLTSQLEDKHALNYLFEAYWKIMGEVRDGPFCPRCWDKNHDQIRMQKFDVKTHRCPECQKVFKTS
jgi:hypothetical protein